ncbi:YHS domain-containing protein (plasmid) [Burkholderia thailandensis]|uniref:YHS domain-containing protein n=1 Tax=Burkholderia thailandensis TaxID=57975 RepID=UPI00192D4345|nr:YHS domain-containing protein [Burkholderia thailandensis]MBS2132160.1 YHS domain-containing protein [Burkholderia thailandensis]QRA15263.1 YHS domain-containing protein [Burkholderia thailandensis]
MDTKDPVCGMQIDTQQAAATEVVGDQTYYFCSASCHDKFRASPDKYVNPTGSEHHDSGHHSGGHHHGC